MHGVTIAENQCTVDCVMIVEDHPLYSDALATTVERIFPKAMIKLAGTLQEAYAELDAGTVPDLVMFDLRLPDVQGISGLTGMKARLPHCPVLVISSLASHVLVDAIMKAGAAAYMPKDCPASELRKLLLDVASGRKFAAEDFQVGDCADDSEETSELSHPKLASLTAQQKRVLKLICEGKPNKQIAYELDLAEATVKAHITALLRRLNVVNRTQAAVLVETLQTQSAGENPEARMFLAQ